MSRDTHQAVREACLWFPEAEEFLSHGAPNFRVRGKTFATYAINHHGDGRVALWLSVAPGAQEWHVGADPKHFFVPPYVGPRGWLGVRLDRGLSWQRITRLVREAFERVAPAALVASLNETPIIRTPIRKLTLIEVDPMRSARGKALLKLARRLCGSLPETCEVMQFGSPVWKAGKKTFLWANADLGHFSLFFWVGIEQQHLLVADPRFRIPPYLGHNGWIALDVTRQSDAAEVAALTLQSYRHFASKRMSRQLAEDWRAP